MSCSLRRSRRRWLW